MGQAPPVPSAASTVGRCSGSVHRPEVAEFAQGTAPRCAQRPFRRTVVHFRRTAAVVLQGVVGRVGSPLERTGKRVLSAARSAASLCPRMYDNNGQLEREGGLGGHRPGVAGTGQGTAQGNARPPGRCVVVPFQRTAAIVLRGMVGYRPERTSKPFLSHGPAAHVLWAMSVTGSKAHAPSVLFPGIGVPVFCGVIARNRSTPSPQRVSIRPRTSGPPRALCIALAVHAATFAPGLSAIDPQPCANHWRPRRTGKPFLSAARSVASLCPRMQDNGGQLQGEEGVGGLRLRTVRARHRNGARTPCSASGPCWTRCWVRERSRQAFLSHDPAAPVLCAMQRARPKAHAPSVLFRWIGAPVLRGVIAWNRLKPRPLRVFVRPLAIGPLLTLCMAFAVHVASFAMSLSANDRSPVANPSDEPMIGTAPVRMDTAPLHTGSRAASFDTSAMSNHATEQALAIVQRPFDARALHMCGAHHGKHRHQRRHGRAVPGKCSSAGEQRRTRWIRGPPPRGPLSCTWSYRSWAAPPQVRRRSQRVDGEPTRKSTTAPKGQRQEMP